MSKQTPVDLSDGDWREKSIFFRDGDEEWFIDNLPTRKSLYLCRRIGVTVERVAMIRTDVQAHLLWQFILRMGSAEKKYIL